MALNKQFSRKLDQLWHRRTEELRALVVPRGAGKPASFNKKVRERMVDDLLDIASRILVRRHARKAFDSVVSGRHLRFLTGRGHRERGQKMVAWAGEKLKGPIVYSFWNRKRCLYVGKGKTWRRLRSYEKSIYLAKANTLRVFAVKTRSLLSKAECLATHLFDPDDRKVRPAKVKWGRVCPVCRCHDLVREEVRGLFRMR